MSIRLGDAAPNFSRPTPPTAPSTSTSGRKAHGRCSSATLPTTRPSARPSSAAQLVSVSEFSNRNVKTIAVSVDRSPTTRAGLPTSAMSVA